MISINGVKGRLTKSYDLVNLPLFVISAHLRALLYTLLDVSTYFFFVILMLWIASHGCSLR